MGMCANGTRQPPINEVTEALRAPLLQVFPAALLGRMVAIPYYPLSDDMLGKIVRLQLGRIQKRVVERYGVPFEYDDSVVQLVTKRCTEVESGGRMIDAVLTNTMLPEISRELLMRALGGKTVAKVGVSTADGAFTYTFD
jgi:type VI secretion system protein VasG